MKLLLLTLVIVLSGCTTINNSINCAAGDNNKPSIKTDAEATQDIAPKTTAKIPLM